VFKKRVLLTREYEDIDRDSKIFLEKNIGVIRLPLIKTVPVPFNLPAIKPDYVIFQSKNAFKYFKSKLESLPGAKIIAVGDKTKIYIEKENLKVWLKPEEQSAKGLCKAMENISKGTVWIPRSKVGGRELINCLKSMGFEIFPIDVYTTINIIYKPEIFTCRTSRADAILFASPSAVSGFFENLKNLYSSIDLKSKMLIAIGNTTKKSLEDRGYTADYIPEKPSVEAISEFLYSFWHNS